MSAVGVAALQRALGESHVLTGGDIGAKYLRDWSDVRGGAHMWISYSLDLRHWGDHTILLRAREGAAEHVPDKRFDNYFMQAFKLLRPGGQFLHHAIARNAAGVQAAGTH